MVENGNEKREVLHSEGGLCMADISFKHKFIHKYNMVESTIGLVFLKRNMFGMRGW